MVSNDSAAPVHTDVSVQEMMGMMDVANALRSQEKEIKSILNHDDQVADLKKRLQATYQAMGKEVDEATLERAIEAHFSNKYSFQEPQHDASYRLAEMYVDRGRIGRQYGIPALALAALVGIGFAANAVIKEAKLASAEAAVEEHVQTACTTKLTLERSVGGISTSPLLVQLPSLEKTEVQNVVDGARRELTSIDSFCDEYAPRGNVKQGVTRSSYLDVGAKLLTVDMTLAAVSSQVEKGDLILGIQQEYVDLQRQLESTIGTVRNSKPLGVYAQKTEAAYQSGLKSIEQRQLRLAKDSLELLNGLVQEEQGLQTAKHELEALHTGIDADKAAPSLTEKAETLYHNGIKSVDQRNLSSAKQAVADLTVIRNNVRGLSTLSSELEKEYQAVTEIAKEAAAKDQAQALYREGQGYLKTVDVPKLRSTVERLNQLDTLLDQEYTLTIVTGPGVKSGMDRYYTDKQGRRSSGYYLIVEARDARRNVIPQNITNEENKQTERVTRWGERVPLEVYEKVKRDKMDDGIIQKDKVGTKERGYLSVQHNSGFSLQGGQITHW